MDKAESFEDKAMADAKSRTKPAFTRHDLKKLNTLAGLYGVRGGAGSDVGQVVTFNTRSNVTKGPDGKPLLHPTGYESLVEAGLLAATVKREGEPDETVTYTLTEDGKKALRGE